MPLRSNWSRTILQKASLLGMSHFSLLSIHFPQAITILLLRNNTFRTKNFRLTQSSLKWAEVATLFLQAIYKMAVLISTQHSWASTEFSNTISSSKNTKFTLIWKEIHLWSTWSLKPFTKMTTQWSCLEEERQSTKPNLSSLPQIYYLRLRLN